MAIGKKTNNKRTVKPVDTAIGKKQTVKPNRQGYKETKKPTPVAGAQTPKESTTATGERTPQRDEVKNIMWALHQDVIDVSPLQVLTEVGDTSPTRDP